MIYKFKNIKKIYSINDIINYLNDKNIKNEIKNNKIIIYESNIEELFKNIEILTTFELELKEVKKIKTIFNNVLINKKININLKNKKIEIINTIFENSCLNEEVKIKNIDILKLEKILKNTYGIEKIKIEF